MKGPDSVTGKRRNSVFERVGLTVEEALQREAAIFNGLATGLTPFLVAAKYQITIPTVYAIDAREATRRGVPPNLGSRKRGPRKTKEEGAA